MAGAARAEALERAGDRVEAEAILVDLVRAAQHLEREIAIGSFVGMRVRSALAERLIGFYTRGGEAERAEAWREYTRPLAERQEVARTTLRGLFAYSDAELLALRGAKDALTGLRIEAQLVLTQRWTLSNPVRMLLGPFPSDRAALFTRPSRTRCSSSRA